MIQTPVLVGYETRFGSTAEVAGVVAEVLVELGLEVELRRTSEVSDVTPYRALVLGAPVYSRRWIRPARRWVRRHAHALRGRGLWYFALGIRVPDGPHASAFHTARLLRRLHQLAPGIEPRGVGLFAGRVDPRIVGIREQLQLRIFRPRTGDFRDWAKIRAWSARVAAEISAGDV